MSELPASITNLTNLTQLYLSGNSLSEIPASITNLTNLTQLYLSDNSLSELPASITNLTNLTQLYLSDNSLSELPASITNLTNLTQLDLSDNSLSELPESITKLTNLIILDLDNNEIKTPPLEIVNQGIKSIRDYFQQIAAGKDYIYEAKLIIVGEGGAGKTTLAKKINNPNYELQTDEATTEGIDVITWKFPLLEKDREFQVNIWDFGGQAIYHATHQFFLTKRSLYALVADTRKDDTDFYYWMNVVELLTDNSPVLIIKNEKQDRHREIEERRLRGEFTNLQEILPTNLKTNRGLDIILDKIKHYIQHLPLVGTALPKTWVDVRKKLEELKNQGTNHISLDAYLTICEENGFDKYNNSLQLSQYLHDLGVCLHFQDDPVLKNTVILEPEWGTDAVYKVLDDNTIIRNLGCFNQQNLDNIWSESKYQRMHDQLLQLMIKFKLCYEISYDKGNYIAPQLLTLDQPEYEWNDKDNLLLRYNYEFMPKGILTRFIVEMHQDIYKDYVWRNGVVLVDSYSRIEVIEYYEKKEIRIRVSGDNKKDPMIIITNEIDKINNSYERIKYNKLIPCNCPTCVNKTEPHFYQLQELKSRVAYKQQNIGCGKPPFHQVEVLDLIDDVIIRNDRLPEPKDKDVTVPKTPPVNNSLTTIKIFLASSSELESDRNEFETFIRRKNDNAINNQIYFQVIMWENFIDAIAENGLQGEYNKAVAGCDIFVSLFHTKVGKYTKEEFTKALETFKENGKPLVFTYFNQEKVTINRNVLSVIEFQEELSELGHFYTKYEGIKDLKFKFNDQLEKIRPELIAKLANVSNANVSDNINTFQDNIAKDQNLTDTNIQGDRNTNNEQLTELLSQLKNAVLDIDIDEEETNDLLEQINAIALFLNNPQDNTTKKTARKGIKMLLGAAAMMPQDSAMVNLCNQLPALINKLF